MRLIGKGPHQGNRRRYDFDAIPALAILLFAHLAREVWPHDREESRYDATAGVAQRESSPRQRTVYIPPGQQDDVP